MTKIIAGFDPGGSTGYCFGQLDESRLGFTVKRCNVIAWKDRIPAIRALLGHFRPDIIIVEDFALYASKAKDMVGKRMQSSEVIGIIGTYIYEFGLPDMRLMMASSISRTEVPADHLKFLPNLVAVQKEHAMDAYKHVRHYVVSQRSAAVKASSATKFGVRRRTQ